MGVLEINKISSRIRTLYPYSCQSISRYRHGGNGAKNAEPNVNTWIYGRWSFQQWPMYYLRWRMANQPRTQKTSWHRQSCSVKRPEYWYHQEVHQKQIWFIITRPKSKFLNSLSSYSTQPSLPPCCLQSSYKE